MRWAEAPAPFRVFFLVVVAALLGVLAGLAPGLSDGGPAGVALAFVALLALSEFAALSFHQAGSRYALSAAEAVLLPMFVILPVSHAVWAATLANAIARPRRWRVAPMQEAFNVAQYGLAAALGSAVWHQWDAGTGSFTIEVALAGAGATLTFAVASHIFVAAAISLAGKGRFRETSLAIAPAFLMNLAGNVVVGLLLAAAYRAASWTIVLFALPLVAMYFGYRAVIRQQHEKDRLENLHAATRALAASHDLNSSLTGFLSAVSEMVSAIEARAIIHLDSGYVWSGIREGEAISSLRPLREAGPMDRLLSELASSGEPVIVGKDDFGEQRAIADELGAVLLLATPLVDDKHGFVGAVVALDRIGPEAFKWSDALLLESLGHELLLSLDSHRLFTEVAQERERFARIFNGSKEGICLIDGDGVVRAWNPALESITGYPASEVMGARWSDRVMIRDASQKRVEGADLVTLASDEVVEVVTRDGPTRWVSVISGPVQSDAEVGGWVVLVRDRTAEHEIEQAKSDFLSTISHELRTPLTTIKGSLQVLGRGTENLPADLTEQMIGVTTRGAERLERLVMNLLIVSQIESGTMPVFSEEISMPDVVRERIATVLRDHQNVDLEVDGKMLHVRADRERLSQVVEHLLENAAKFGGPEGKITVKVSRSNGYAHLSVTDEGPGIPASDQERIFERFVRLGDLLTRETQGAGVGLFIAQSAVEAMEGHIWVESEPGSGATFHVEIPLSRPMVVEQAEGA